MKATRPARSAAGRSSPSARALARDVCSTFGWSSSVTLRSSRSVAKGVAVAAAASSHVEHRGAAREAPGRVRTSMAAAESVVMGAVTLLQVGPERVVKVLVARLGVRRAAGLERLVEPRHAQPELA